MDFCRKFLWDTCQLENHALILTPTCGNLLFVPQSYRTVVLPGLLTVFKLNGALKMKIHCLAVNIQFPSALASEIRQDRKIL